MKHMTKRSVKHTIIPVSGALVVGVVMLAHSLAMAMPLSPTAVDKAGGIGVLSGELLAPPPAYVDQPLPIPAVGHSGNYKVLLILIKFSDLANSFSRASFDSMAFTGWPTGSIRNYFLEVSYGQLSLTGQALGWYTASGTRAYYGNGQKGWGAYPQNAARLVEEAVDAAEAAGCDFSQYDNDGDGMAESIFIVHSGEGCETSLNTNDIQSHVSSITGLGGSARNYDGVTIDTYACCPELQKTVPLTHVNIGVYCHEYGHLLGLPDLYDTGRYCTSRTGWGVGAWCLMAYGGWGGNVVSPWWPAHMSAWCKIQMGWLTPTVIHGLQPLTLSGIEAVPVVYKLGMDARETQYFLIAFRDSAIGFDRSLPKKGLLIWHIDDDMWTYNDCENGGICTSGGFNYMVALEQPDGNYNLDCGTTGNYGDRGDVYPYLTNDAFGPSTTPNSDTYDGTASGVLLTTIAFANPGRTQMSLSATAGQLYPEIGYDDGFYNICYYWGQANSGFAVRVTPPAYPAFVRGLLIMSCDPYNPNFQCKIWDDNGPSGTPGTGLTPVHTTSGTAATDWTYVDFTADSVTVNSGDFWAVYIEYNNSDIASDNNSAWSGRTMMYYMGNFYADNGTYGNYMIRAVVDTGSCAGIETAIPVAVEASVGPNPFRQNAEIRFSLAEPTPVSISVYDVSGRLVRRIADRTFGAGSHSVVWDGTDRNAKRVSAGIYFYRLTAGQSVLTGKISLLE